MGQRDYRNDMDNSPSEDDEEIEDSMRLFYDEHSNDPESELIREGYRVLREVFYGFSRAKYNGDYGNLDYDLLAEGNDILRESVGDRRKLEGKLNDPKDNSERDYVEGGSRIINQILNGDNHRFRK